jgi:hypothetical protein
MVGHFLCRMLLTAFRVIGLGARFKMPYETVTISEPLISDGGTDRQQTDGNTGRQASMDVDIRGHGIVSLTLARRLIAFFF